MNFALYEFSKTACIATNDLLKLEYLNKLIMNTITEIWKEVEEYEGLYEVSNFGRVKSLARFAKHSVKGKRKVNETILKNVKDKNGYQLVNLHRNGKMKTVKVHRLVALAFIPNPKNKPQVNHKDGVKSNNFWWNLEWATLSENRQHAYDTGLQNSDHCKKKVAQIKDGKILKVWESLQVAGEQLGIQKTGISACCRGRYKISGGFNWIFS